MNKTIINFCPTGMVPTKQSTAYVPVGVEETIEQVRQAWELGITIVHVHARLDDGCPTYLSSVYQPIFEGIRKHCPGLIISASTSGRNWPEFEKRSEVIELFPDMCSLTLSSLNFVNQVSVNAPETIKALAEKMKAYGVVPELECFDLGMVNYGLYLIQKGLVDPPHYWNLLFGNIAGFQPKLSHMSAATMEIPVNHYVCLAGIGTDQLKINSMAIALGYGVRVGIEDNIWWDVDRKNLATNIGLIKRIHQLMEIHGSTLFTSKELGESGFYNRKHT